MATSVSALLTNDHYLQLRNALDQAAQIQREIDLAKRAGIPIDPQQTLLTQIQQQIQAIKATYFPNQV